MKYKTEQEEFWAGAFGNDYINRNNDEKYFRSNIQFFAKALRNAPPINSCLEFGANIGMNLKALNFLFPDMTLKGIEINPIAAKLLCELIGTGNTIEKSILDFEPSNIAELTLIKGVLIHIAPHELSSVYTNLYLASKKFILICEYYNPTPVSVDYRGHKNRLFKRDFCGEMLDMFPDLQLRDYGFTYHRDPHFPQDDVSWFLLEKSSQS